MGGVAAAGTICPFCKNAITTSKFRTSFFLMPRCFLNHKTDGTSLSRDESQELKCQGSGRPVPTTSPWWAGLGRKKRR
jgi:hypothetical protein